MVRARSLSGCPQHHEVAAGLTLLRVISADVTAIGGAAARGLVAQAVPALLLVEAWKPALSSADCSAVL
jgi:hypothetical protein